ncbi:unnamed protein product [Hymenolepis diminuta]|uniref:C3H1-type domain-containing protein n=1 Tax=Hymenolepis diminuta TaxID=6216 RepID=A0A564YR05_HYMDI|nr:unnamed protein product [Hymenolepis diminuta]
MESSKKWFIEQKTKNVRLCEHFWKTGACQFLGFCLSYHPKPPLHAVHVERFKLKTINTCPLVIIIENMFDHPSLKGDSFNVDESKLLPDYNDFYADVRFELENECGEPIKTFRCCKNTSLHLRGNVYIESTRNLNAALYIASRLRRRTYNGKPLVARVAYLGRGWESAICGLYRKGNCPIGDRHCRYIHFFKNPKKEDKVACEGPPRPSLWQNRSKTSRRHSVRSDISSKNQGCSQGRHQHKSRSPSSQIGSNGRHRKHRHSGRKRSTSIQSPRRTTRSSKNRIRSRDRHSHRRGHRRKRSTSVHSSDGTTHLSDCSCKSCRHHRHRRRRGHRRKRSTSKRSRTRNGSVTSDKNRSRSEEKGRNRDDKCRRSSTQKTSGSELPSDKTASISDLTQDTKN